MCKRREERVLRTGAGEAEGGVGGELARVDAEQRRVGVGVARRRELEGPGAHFLRLRAGAVAALAADGDLDLQRPGVDVGQLAAAGPALGHRLGVADHAVGRAAVHRARALDHMALGPAAAVGPDGDIIGSIMKVGREAAAGDAEALRAQRAA